MIDSEPIKKYALAPIKTHHISKINTPEPKMHQPLLLIWSIASWGGTTGANEDTYTFILFKCEIDFYGD